MQVIFGPQHVVDAFFPYHQSVDVVPFDGHDLDECHDTEYDVAVQAHEIVHQAVFTVDIEGKEGGEHNDASHQHPELTFRRFVAEKHFQLQPHVFAYIAITVEETIAADVSDMGIFLA